MNNKVIVHRGKHDIGLFADTDNGWREFFKSLDESEYYYDITDNENLEEQEGKLEELIELEKKINTLPSIIREHAEAALRYKSQIETDIRSTKEQRGLYSLALKGNVKAIKRLMGLRQRYEYERYDVMEVVG